MLFYFFHHQTLKSLFKWQLQNDIDNFFDDLPTYINVNYKYND